MSFPPKAKTYTPHIFIFILVTECFDKKDNCEDLKKAGFCTSTVPIMEYEVKTNCLETCEFCGEHIIKQKTCPLHRRKIVWCIKHAKIIFNNLVPGTNLQELVSWYFRVSDFTNLLHLYYSSQRIGVLAKKEELSVMWNSNLILPLVSSIFKPPFSISPTPH